MENYFVNIGFKGLSQESNGDVNKEDNVSVMRCNVLATVTAVSVYMTLYMTYPTIQEILTQCWCNDFPASQTID